MFSVRPLRLIVRTMVSPTRFRAMAFTRASSLVTGWPSMAVIKSPPIPSSTLPMATISRAADTCRVLGRPTNHTLDKQTATARQPQSFREIAGHIFGCDSNLRTLGHAAGLEICEQGLCTINWQSEADTDVGLAQNGGVDPNHHAVGIEQRTAAVAAVDRSIGLDHAFQLLIAFAIDFSANRTHHAYCQRSFQTKRVANGQHFLADLEMVGIAELQKRSLLFRIDFDQGEIVRAVSIERARIVLALIRKRNLDTAAARNHVVIGQDEAVFVDQETGTETLSSHRLIEEIAAHGCARDVDGREAREFIDIDVVLLLRREPRAVYGGGFGPLHSCAE